MQVVAVGGRKMVEKCCGRQPKNCMTGEGVAQGLVREKDFNRAMLAQLRQYMS